METRLEVVYSADMRAFAPLAALVLFATAAMTYAQTVPTAPEGYRYMGPDRADSDCIGDISTPNCAAETYYACFVRTDPNLCERVGLAGMAFKYERASYFFLYQIAGVVQITPERVTRALANEPWYRPGNVEVRIKGTTCRPGKPCRVDVGWRRVLFMSPVAEGWRLVGWAADSGEVVCEHAVPGDPYSRNCALFVHNDRLPWIFEYD